MQQPEQSLQSVTSPIEHASAAAPVTQPERISSIDVLRGGAVLGILAMNITAFANPFSAYSNPNVHIERDAINNAVWYFCHLLFDAKMMSIFSMLFGAGVVLMTERAERKSGRSAAVHYRRMAWLLLFGLLHGYLLWTGDILYSYAMCGFAIWLVRRWPAWILLVLGLFLVSMTSALNLVTYVGVQKGHVPPDATAWVNSFINPTPVELQAELDSYRGSWLQQMPRRAADTAMFQTLGFVAFMLWRSAGMMLVGMALYKWGVFSARRSFGFYAALMVLGFGIGLPVIHYGSLQIEANNWDPVYTMYVGFQYNYWASILVALAWVGGVMLFCKLDALTRLRSALAAAGQMALTNYLMQSTICTTIFYGHGLGLFGTFDRLQQLYTVLAVWAAELVWSLFWLRHFQFGPFEWLWRSLTYWRVQRIRRVSD